MKLKGISVFGTLLALFSYKYWKGRDKMGMKNVKTNHYVMLTLEFSHKGEWWLAQCEELGTAIQAKTLDEAVSVIKETVAFHLNALEEENERERFFLENGITVFASQPPKAIQVTIPENRDTLIQPFQVAVPCFT